MNKEPLIHRVRRTRGYQMMDEAAQKAGFKNLNEARLYHRLDSAKTVEGRFKNAFRYLKYTATPKEIKAMRRVPSRISHLGTGKFFLKVQQGNNPNEYGPTKNSTFYARKLEIQIGHNPKAKTGQYILAMRHELQHYLQTMKHGPDWMERKTWDLNNMIEELKDGFIKNISKNRNLRASLARGNKTISARVGRVLNSNYRRYDHELEANRAAGPVFSTYVQKVKNLRNLKQSFKKLL